jgi:hypothetical protein
MDLATLALSGLMLGSTIADVETARGHWERNPVLRPLSDSRVKMYTVKGGVTAGVSVLSVRLRRSPNKHERILGWALPVLSIGLQSLAARHNARLP